NATDIVTLEMTDIERGGDDLIYADAEDLGDDILMGQAGNDTIRAGGGDDVILGDIALFTFLHPHDRLPGQSAADRMLRLEATRIDIGGDDLIYGGIGNDIAVAGFGADLMYGGDGQDILIGDTAIITRRWVDEAKGGLTEWLTIDTNFAFIQGGYDHIHGEGDHDVMVGNLGPDMFYGDTAEDAIFSDGYAGLFRAWLPQGFEGRAENDQRYLYTSNFAGAGAVDVVSNAQQNAAIGNPLDAVEDGSLGKVLTFPGRNALDPDLWRRTIDMLDEPRMLRAMAQMIAMGADSELLADSMLSSLIEAGLLSGDTDPVMLELLIERLAKVLHQRAQNDAAMGERPLAAE
ncbi:MAG: calcium-binding protein, partial [Cereibacter changlensis]